MITSLSTKRLLLRQWQDGDLDQYADLTADPEVMRHFPAPLTRAESDAMVARLSGGIAERGWGCWAVEIRETGELAGFVGLNPLNPIMPFAPGVEIGWRLAHRFWGRGYAPEAATRAVAFAFDDLGLTELVAFTSAQNQPSRRVMEKLGMTHDPADDFDHPGVPVDWPERRHVLYRLRP